jgi:hypothetical protein
MKFILTLCHGLSYASPYVSSINFSLNIFFTETMTPRKLIFCRNLLWGVLFKICSWGSEIPNIFRTGSEKLGNKAKSLNLLLVQNRKCYRWTKTCFIIPKRSFLKFTFSRQLPVTDIFPIMLPRVRRYE